MRVARGVVGVELDAELEVGGADGFALDEAYVLDLEDGLVVVGEGFVLNFMWIKSQR